MVTISKLLKALAVWLEARFPEKIQASSVLNEIGFLHGAFQGITKRSDEIEKRIESLLKFITDHEKKISDLNDEMNRAKTYLAIKSRVVGNGSFQNSPLPPIIPKPQ